MNDDQKPKLRTRHPDRVSLSPDSLNRLAGWTIDAEGHLKGSRLTKSDLVNFLIKSHSASLSERELEELERDHFDEVRFAAWALRQIKEARAQGKDLSLADVVNAAPGARSKPDSEPSPKPVKPLPKS